MMAHANLPISFWGDALLTVAYIPNHVPGNSVTATPYELWHGRKPPYDHLWPWGLADYMHNPTHKYGKLGPRATKMMFTRYPAYSKGYVIYGAHPNGGMTEIESRNVNFREDKFPSIGEIKKDLELYELQQDLQPSLGEGEDLNSRQATENGEPVQENEVRFHIPTPVENQPEDVKSPHAQEPMPQRDTGSISPQARVLTLLRERGRDSQLDRQIIKGS